MKKTTPLQHLERRVEILEELVLRLSRDSPSALPVVLPSKAAVDVAPAFTPDPSWIRIVHRNGDYPCHKTAWYLIRKFWRGEKGDLQAIRLLNGAVPEIGDAPLCGNCQRPVHPFTQQDLDFEPALVNTPSQLDTLLVKNRALWDEGG
jgi:hypothetical protein